MPTATATRTRTASPQELMWRSQLADEMAKGAATTAIAAQSMNGVAAANVAVQRQGGVEGDEDEEGMDEEMRQLLKYERRERRLEPLTKALMRRYEKEMEVLEKDMNTELSAFRQWLRKAIAGLSLSGVSDGINAMSLGTLWTVVNWVRCVVEPILDLYRAWQNFRIPYLNPFRKVRRTLRLYQRMLQRAITKLVLRLFSAIPVLNIIPVPTFLKWMDFRFLFKHIRVLESVMRMVATTKPLTKLRYHAAGSWHAKYGIMQSTLRTLKTIEKRFDES